MPKQEETPQEKELHATHVRAHSHWAHITLLGAYRAPSYAVDGNGTSYVADTSGGPWTWQLECDCGFRWEMLECRFPGKRRLKSCGMPECPHTRREPTPVVKRHGVSLSIYAEHDVFVVLSDYCAKRNVTMSRAVNELCREGALAKLINDDE